MAIKKNIEIHNQAVAEQDVVKLNYAIASLYQDRIYPNDSCVKARLRKFGYPAAGLNSFVEAYRSLPDFEVTDTGILFRQEPPNFQGWVDATSNFDSYPQMMWDRLEDYIRSLNNNDDTESEFEFKFRTRAEIAERLYAKKLDFLMRYSLSLGAVYHIVYLASTTKELIEQDAESRLWVAGRKITMETEEEEEKSEGSDTEENEEQ